MKWILAIQKPYKAAIILFLVMISVIAFSLVNRKQIGDINKSMASIYHDRLLPASDIFHLTQYLYQKRSLIESYIASDGKAASPVAEMAKLDGKIDMLITRYEKTYLVKEEQQNLKKLKKELGLYQQHENTVIQLRQQSKEIATAHYRQVALPRWQTSLNRLSELNDIQASVGGKLVKSSDSIDAASGLLSTIQMCIVIFMGTIVIALTFNHRVVNTIQRNYKWN